MEDSIASTLAALEHNGGMGATALADKIGVSRATVLRNINVLRYAGRVRIAEWQLSETKRQLIPIYALGTEPDEPRPDRSKA